MESRARLNNCPLPPRKMRLLADLVRGIEVEDAFSALKHHPKKMYASYLDKLIQSAVANWIEKNEDADVDESGLYIKEVFVDGGRVLKRIQPAPQGRAHRIRKRSNHITVVIDSKVDVDAAKAEVEEVETENSDNE